MIDRPEEYEKMDLAERELWWYRILHEQTLRIIQKKFKTNDISILDAACGTGGLIHYLQGKGFKNIQGFDLSQEAVERSRNKTTCVIKHIDLKEVSVHYTVQSFDVVVCHDALYFVEDSSFPAALKDVWSLLKTNGLLIINLPAGNWFKGMHDRSVGIKDRWNVKKFQRMLSLSGINYQSLDHRNWPFLLSPLILSARLFQRFKLMLFPKTAIQSDVELPPLALNHIFYKLTKWEDNLPLKRNFGSSLFIVIRK